MSTSKSNKTPCPKCGTPLRLAGLPAGENVHCPKCNGLIVVGGAKPAAPKAKQNTTRKVTTVVPKEQPAEARPVEAGPPQVVTVHPFEERQAGELPVAKPVLNDSPDGDDDDAYEPEIPLIPSVIAPQEPIVDANLGSFKELRREIDSNVSDDLEAEESRGPTKDHSEQYLESARRRGMVRNFHVPDPPRWTFFSGVFGYPWRGPNIGRWAAMSLLLSVAVVLDLQALEMLGFIGGRGLDQGAVQGLIMAVFAIGATVFAGMFVLPSMQAGIQDTADGHDLPQVNTFPDFDQWAMILLGWIILAAGAAAIGYPLSLFLGDEAMLGSALLLFPILLLSALEADSYVVPISPPVLRSLGNLAGSWIMFYLVSTLVLIAACAAVVACAIYAPAAVWLLGGPLFAAVGLIYARLLGRLAWKAAGAKMAPIELDDGAETDELIESVKSVADPKRTKKRRPRVRIVVPDESDSPTKDDDRPRINFHHRS